MTIRFSNKRGKSWTFSKLLFEGPSAYSSLTVLPDGNIACLFEAGVTKPYEGIVFEEVDLAELLTPNKVH